jgi:hypothetical protein
MTEERKLDYSKVENRAEAAWIYATSGLTKYEMISEFGSEARINVTKWLNQRSVISYIAEMLECSIEDVKYIFSQKASRIKANRQAHVSRGMTGATR